MAAPARSEENTLFLRPDSPRSPCGRYPGVQHHLLALRHLAVVKWFLSWLEVWVTVILLCILGSCRTTAPNGWRGDVSWTGKGYEQTTGNRYFMMCVVWREHAYRDYRQEIQTFPEESFEARFYHAGSCVWVTRAEGRFLDGYQFRPCKPSDPYR
jgi:hypothetical protein